MKLLVVSSRFPYPIEKGDKLRLYYQLRYLSQFHDIYLVCLHHGHLPAIHRQHIEQFCKKIYVFKLTGMRKILNLGKSVFSKLPLQVHYFFDPAIKRKIRRILLNEDIDHIYCQLVRTAEYVRTFPLPKTIDYMDALSSGMKRRAEQSSVPLRWFYRAESDRLRRYERQIWKYFDHHTIISQRDNLEISGDLGFKSEVIPNGVDLNYFSARIDGQQAYDLVFVGNLGYAPNVDAAVKLVQWTKDLEFQGKPITIHIAGARPTRRVINLADDRVEVSGWVEDIREAYCSGKIFAAPIFTGSGLQNKMLEAMAMGIPTLSTSMVNASLGAQPDRDLFIADTKEEFQKILKKSLGNPGVLQDIAENARIFVENHYSWDEFNLRLHDLIMQPLPQHGYSSFTSNR